MLPFGAQGANQAIEGAGLVGLIFQEADAGAVLEKVKKFEGMRWKRISIIKLLSSIRFGREADAAYGVIKHNKVNPKGRSDTGPFQLEVLQGNTDNFF